MAEIKFEKVTKESHSYLFADDKPKKFSNSTSEWTVEDLIKALSKLDKSKTIVIDTTEWFGDSITILEDTDGKYVLNPYG